MRVVMKNGTVHHIKGGAAFTFSKESGHGSRVSFWNRNADKITVKCREVEKIDHKRGNKP